MTLSLKAVGVACAIFVVGAGAGSLVTAFIGVRALQRNFQRSLEGPGLIERGLVNFRADLVRQVQPDAQQLAEIDKELATYGEELREQKRAFAVELVRDMRRASGRVRSHLDDTRKARFDEMMRSRLARFGFEQRLQP